MWNTTLFLAELLGTFVLVFGVVATLHATSKTKFSGMKLRLVQGVGISLSLTLGVYAAIALGKMGNYGKAPGFVNPAVALMHAIGNNNYDLLLSSITGEIIGAILGGVSMFFILCITSTAEQKNGVRSIFKVEDENVTLKSTGKNVIGEIASSAIFLGGVAATAVFGSAGNIGPLMVGISLFLAIIILGHRFGQLFNPAAGLAMGIMAIAVGKSKIKVVVANYVAQLIGITAIAAAIGGTYYGFSTL